MARKWPLLADGQDPDTLEARVAFHLHRLGLAGHQLLRTRFLPQAMLKEIAQARMSIRQQDATALAQALGITPAELTRSLSPEEINEWSYYRHSARHPRYAWQRARALWQSAGMSSRTAAAVMNIPQHLTSAALNDQRRPRVMPYAAANYLTTALNLPGGPHFLLIGADEKLPADHDVNELTPIYPRKPTHKPPER